MEINSSAILCMQDQVCAANKRLVSEGLVKLTWGNVSGRIGELVCIKPSGVSYDDLEPESIVVLTLSGDVVAGELKPSSDTLTHLAIYRAFPEIRAVVHTHSHYATCWAQAGRNIPEYGTTHADVFFGDVPCTNDISQDKVASDYELETGNEIVRALKKWGIERTCGILVRSHGPFTWGQSPSSAVDNAVSLEEVARMALDTEILLNHKDMQSFMPEYLKEKHYFRKHGSGAYYGQ